MPRYAGLRKSLVRRLSSVILIGLLANTLASCKKEEKIVEPQPRPVRTATVEKSEAGVPVVVTGRIEALDEAALGFRISGRMIERNVKVGDRVEPGQLLGRLEALNELNALRVAQANFAAAEAKKKRIPRARGLMTPAAPPGWQADGESH